MAKWTRKKEPTSCPFAKKETEKFGFDVTKANQIFDLLLQEGQIKLSANHTRVNWICAIIIFRFLRYAITIRVLGTMPLQFI